MILKNKLINAINKSSLLRRFTQAVVFGIGGSIGSRALLMLSSVIISRILGQELFGQFSMINSTVTLFVTFSAMGISATLTRYVALYRSDIKKIGELIGSLSLVVSLMALVMSIFMFLFSSNLSVLVSGTSILGSYFKITSVTIFVSAIGSIQHSILLGMEKYRITARVEIIRCFIYVLVAFFLTRKYGLNGAIISLLVSEVIKLLMMSYENKKFYKQSSIRYRIKFDSEIIKIIYMFTIPSFLSSLLVLPVNWINNSILARSMGFSELAIFSIALQWMTIVTYIPAQMSQVKPIYTDLFSKRKFDSLKKMFLNITMFTAGLSIPIIIIMISFSGTILDFYGEGYNKGSLTFSLLMIVAFLIILQAQVGTILESIGKVWYGLVLNSIWSVVITLTFYSLREYGSVGYALAYCLSYVLHNVLSFILLYYLWRKKEKLNFE